MQLIDGRPVYSATDLVGFLACAHLTNLERAVLAGMAHRPNRPDPELDRIRIRGEQHEQRYLRDLAASGRQVTSLKLPEDAWQIDKGAVFRAAASATEEAIRAGAQVIYQACFFDGTWLGFADFLLRVDAPPGEPVPPLGWSYEVSDTKLARSAKASALLQMCSYVEQLERIQDWQPRSMHVALGGSAREVASFRVGDYMAYYRTVKGLFEAAVASATPPSYPPVTTYPDPVEHCDVCRWAIECSARRRADDDLSLVAGIGKRTRKELKEERGTPTRRALAGLHLPLTPRLEGTGAAALLRVREQARLQVEGEDAGETRFELLDPTRTTTGDLAPNKGLLALPPPSPNDLFLDLEGDPFALDDGIDYLFGILEPGRTDANGGPTFHAFWARDGDGTVTLDAERRAFERAIDLIVDRLARDPTLHVYHYAAYERTALGRLMGRHATREVEVDRLFRGGTLVDLYQVVRQSVRASVESYSIKRLEPLYGYAREVDLRDAGSSIVAFETWLEVGGEGGRDDETLVRIERYNRDDVVSTWLLRDWLEARRPELAANLGQEQVPRLVPASDEEGENLAEWLRRVRELSAPLLEGLPKDDTERASSPGAQARWLLAQLLGWHRREQKAGYWRYFYLRDALTDEERVAEREPLACLELLGVVDEDRRLFRYGFPEQEYDISEGQAATDPETRKDVTVETIDALRREVVLRHVKTREMHHPRSLVRNSVVRTTAQEESLASIAESVIADGIDGDGPYRSARDLLLRREPRVGQAAGVDLRRSGETAEEAARRLALQLDRTALPIQGPPGSGKTWLGARMILDLVAAGRQVGVTANSHRVIGNLLDAVWAAAQSDPRFAQRPIRLAQKPGEREPPTCANAVAHTDTKQLHKAMRDGEFDVIGATSWLWAAKDLVSSVDVLVIDEAGQFSLANAVAVAPAAASLVLLGDPQQLDQPVQGTHPPGAERSALAHLLGSSATMPPDRGLFLERTWRLHPAIAGYTSEAFYDDRLEAEPGNERQALAGRGPLDGVGIRFLPVDHAGDATDSVDEARAVARLVRDVLASGATWVDRTGVEMPIGWQDILIVSPYNLHRDKLSQELPEARVGTVDKFQGQQAPISIYSMASSSAEDAPRGMEFLYSLNRLNVATSRARCLTLVVASPALLRVRCSTPRQMQLANALCRLVEVAGEGSLTIAARAL